MMCIKCLSKFLVQNLLAILQNIKINALEMWPNTNGKGDELDRLRTLPLRKWYSRSVWKI